MEEVSRRDGRTVLVVSHNIGLVTSLCPVVIWLDRGAIHQQGSTRAVIGDYLFHGSPSLDRLVKLGELAEKPDFTGGRLRLESIEWLSELPLRHGERVKARIHIERTKSTFRCVDSHGLFKFGGNSATQLSLGLS